MRARLIPAIGVNYAATCGAAQLGRRLIIIGGGPSRNRTDPNGGRRRRDLEYGASSSSFGPTSTSLAPPNHLPTKRSSHRCPCRDAHRPLSPSSHVLGCDARTAAVQQAARAPLLRVARGVSTARVLAARATSPRFQLLTWRPDRTHGRCNLRNCRDRCKGSLRVHALRRRRAKNSYISSGLRMPPRRPRLREI